MDYIILRNLKYYNIYHTYILNNFKSYISFNNNYITYKIRFHILFNHLSLGKVYIINTY